MFPPITADCITPMEQPDFLQTFTELKPEDRRTACRDAFDRVDTMRPALLDVLRKAPSADLKDESVRRRLEIATLFLAAKRDSEAFADLYRLIRQPAFTDAFTENDWFITNLHRLLAACAAPDDLGAIGDIVLEPALLTPIREQALLAFHFLWFEKVVSEKDIIDEYRRLLEQGLAPEDDWKLWMALVMNAAVVGGAKLKPQVLAILDSGKLSDQTSFVRKVVNGLFTNGNRQLRDMLRAEHRGFFDHINDELDLLFDPPKPQDLPDMPGKGKPLIREEPKIGRNDPCPCGSGKKYKKCCGAALA